MTENQEERTQFFWDIAVPLLADETVSKGTMMGFPCLRVNGDFFASVDRNTGDLIVKLPADRVEAMIDDGTGDAFAPNGRRFREWIAVTDRDEDRWALLLIEARDFVQTKA
jgi:hypothetical protein